MLVQITCPRCGSDKLYVESYVKKGFFDAAPSSVSAECSGCGLGYSRELRGHNDDMTRTAERAKRRCIGKMLEWKRHSSCDLVHPHEPSSTVPRRIFHG